MFRGKILLLWSWRSKSK